jgi:hypothetical protein
MSLRRDALPRVQFLCSPSQLVQFALVQPIIRLGNQLMPDWIAANVLPFLIIALTATQLPIPVIPLPNAAADLAQITCDD